MKKNFKNLLLLGILIISSLIAISQDRNYENEKYVVVIDVQQCWTDRVLSKTDSAEMITAINKLIDKTHPDKIFYIKSNASGYQKVASISLRGIKVDSVKINAEFDKKLKIVSNNIFEKFTGDSFTVKEMTSIFEQNNAKEIILTGLLADKCVFDSAIGGISQNYSIYIVPEAIGAKSEKSKKKTIDKLLKKGVKTISMNDL
jgi:nicotinamidase-related amidase